MVDATNYQLLRELEDTFSPRQRGIFEDDEVAKIEDSLKIKERTILDLRNLRDFTVLYLGNRKDMYRESKKADTEENVKKAVDLIDLMSGITTVIDTQIFALGGEV